MHLKSYLANVFRGILHWCVQSQRSKAVENPPDTASCILMGGEGWRGNDLHCDGHAVPPTLASSCSAAILWQSQLLLLLVY